MPNDYPFQDLCTKSIIWPWPISQGHSSHFSCDIVKIQKPDKFYPYYASAHRRWWPEALCFWSVCPCFSPSVHLSVHLCNLVGAISLQRLDGSSSNLTWLLTIKGRWTDYVFKVMGSRSYGVIYTNLVCAISREEFEWSSPNLTRTPYEE